VVKLPRRRREIDHRGPQCDAHGLIMKLEIRSTEGIAVLEFREIICCVNRSSFSNECSGTLPFFTHGVGDLARILIR